METPKIQRVSQILTTILETKYGEGVDFLQMLGATEVIQELLKNKICYQILTMKRPFEIITGHLVSDDEDTKRHMYILLTSLTSFFEQHEKLEKRINIDNFEDEDLMNSHSGSGLFNKSKNSRNSKKLNQEIYKDMQDSDLFKYANVVINEITAYDIEAKHVAIKEGRDSMLGSYFMSIIEFLEKSSSTFTGFPHDINQTLIDIDLYDYIFDIVEFYDRSDFLMQKVFKITHNIIKDRNDEVAESLKVLFDQTRLIDFLIKNSPKVVETIEDPVSPKANTSKNEEKSPEQATKAKEGEDLKASEEKPKIVTMPSCQNQSALQAHVKILSELVQDYVRKDKS